MLGTFAPQREPYVLTLDEETTPSGVLARGNYSAKLKVWSCLVGNHDSNILNHSKIESKGQKA